jgi:hypothetical protein
MLAQKRYPWFKWSTLAVPSFERLNLTQRGLVISMASWYWENQTEPEGVDGWADALCLSNEEVDDGMQPPTPLVWAKTRQYLDALMEQNSAISGNKSVAQQNRRGREQEPLPVDLPEGFLDWVSKINTPLRGTDNSNKILSKGNYSKMIEHYKNNGFDKEMILSKWLEYIKNNKFHVGFQRFFDEKMYENSQIAKKINQDLTPQQLRRAEIEARKAAGVSQ